MDNNHPALEPGLPEIPGQPLRAYRNEQGLFIAVAIVAALFWLALIGVAATASYLLHPVLALVVVVPLILIYLVHLVAMSVFIAHLKGNAVRITAEQFPDLYTRLLACCRRVNLNKIPEAFVMSGDGMLNAFAARFLRRYYVVLLSDVLNAVEHDPEAVNFYIGHELAHIHRGHIAFGWFLHPAMFLPLIATAYRRAQEYTCDQYGLACCESQFSAAQAMAVLAAGPQQSRQLNLAAYLKQCEDTKGFWMSINELNADYPWLCKRMRHISPQSTQRIPGRNPLAWFLSVLIFRFGVGAFGFNLLMSIVVWTYIGVAAYGAYQHYKEKAVVVGLFNYGTQVTTKVTQYFVEHEVAPEDLAVLHLDYQSSGLPIRKAEIDEFGVVTLTVRQRQRITYEPSFDESGKLVWECTTDIQQDLIPKSAHCRYDGLDFEGLGNLMR